MTERNTTIKAADQHKSIFITDKEFKIIYANQSFLDALQFDETEILKKSLNDILPNLNYKTAGGIAAASKLINTECVKRDGIILNKNFFIKPLIDDSGNIFGHQFVDYTNETSLSFDSLLSSLGKTYKTIPDIFILLSSESTINQLIVYAPLNNLINPPDLINKNVDLLFGREISSKLNVHIQNVKKKNRIFTLEFFHHINKEQKIFEIRLSLFIHDQIAIVLRDITKFKVVEQEYKKLESRFRTIWEHSLDGMRLIDSCGNIVSVNQAFCNIVEMDEDALIAKPFYCIYAKENEQQNKQALDRIKNILLKKRFNSYFEGPVKLANGKTKMLRIDNSLIEVPTDLPLFDREIYMLSVFKDLTDLEKSHEEVIKYNQALEYSGDGVLLYDENEIITYANSSVSFLLGLNKSEIINRRVSLLLNEIITDKKSALKIKDNLFWNKEINLKKSNGQKLTAEISNDHVYDQHGKIESNILLLRDITQRKNAEEALKTSEARLRSVWENAADGMALSTICGKIIDANSAFCTLSGIQSTELIGKMFYEIIQDDTQKLKDNIPSFQKMIHDQKFHKSHSKLKFISGKECFGLITHSVIEIENHDPLLLTIFRDLTKQREKEAEYQKIEGLAKLGEMSAHLSHEFKNPLSSLKNFLEMMSESKELSVSQKEAVLIMQSEVVHLNMLLKDVLEFARFQKYVFSEINLRDLFQRIKEMKQTALAKNSIALNLFVDEIKIRGDYVNVLSVFTNLVENAIDAVPFEGEIEVRSVIVDGTVKIYIKDNGCGISNPEKVFDPFYSTKASGTGLGLAIAKKIIQQHNGGIKIISSNPGSTIFEVSFNQISHE